ncbi:MAG: dihydrodipicolinate synthase family protein [Clostridiaceae bacterium]|nr:dihydrodipicolinate synthase family protein [Clostridiaceae bacterium]
MRQEAARILAEGTVIPAMPLVIRPDRTLDSAGQRRLIRYYLAAGAGGLAVGVHTTQFEIRQEGIGLFEPVLALAADEIQRHEQRTGQAIVRVAGACGPTDQAVREADLARHLGYDAVLLSPGGLAGLSEAELLERTRAVAARMPVIGFYLQPAVGGRVFSFAYWQQLCAIGNVVAIKAAPFDRYLTLDVLRAAALSERAGQIALYTGNDDHILLDLLTEHRFEQDGRVYTARFTGGLLGHWAVWTHQAVALFRQLKAELKADSVKTDWLTLASQVTDCNSAVFDTANRFAGCITGIHEVLRRQGLMDGIWTLEPGAGLSPGQGAALDRIQRQYPHLNDDAFVRDFLARER